MSGIIFLGGDIFIVTPITLVWIGAVFGIVFFAAGFAAKRRSKKRK